MDLNPAQRKLVFGVVVLVLAALGAFLLSGTSPSPAGPGSQPTPAPAGLGATPPGTGPDIYRWLPFSQAGLTAAADVVGKFATAYASYSYTQTAASYERQFNGLVTASLAAVLGRGFATPGVVQPRVQQKQIATGTGQITAIRSFGANNITFVVAITQKVTGTKGTKRTTTDYAVTVTGAGTSWQVEDLELASAGNT